ncbi:hypothetical protein B0A48_00534 [Cryoendolithus antarcticus]|uniref:Telomeric single stranded DNA binding POT1/Cdc13 domain-containing protein n=1 Tax=Cryoendolithus antarcticus TaxID=1507870 RepID=A0A1V8TVG0_9PEZI|nr:hypothetical protein B0A48_00534 [Cryoendolithus antarcticus]
MAPTTAVVPIQSLDTSVPPSTGQMIRAVVTLCWPYSSSTRQCALLLADPDFRRRSRKGQVRVRFHGVAAEAIAKAKPGIGDEVELELGGAGWVGSGLGGEMVQTPGKSVGELEYHGAVRLRLSRDGGSVQNVFVEKKVVNEQAHAPVHVHEMQQPAPIRSHVREHPRANFGAAPLTSSSYSSPAFLHRARLAEDNSLDRLFAEDVDGDGSPRKRVRVSIGEVRDWRVVSRTPSPVKEHSPAEAVSSPHEFNASRKVSPFPSLDAHTEESPPSNGHEMSMSPNPAPRPIDEDIYTRIDAWAMLPPVLPRLQVPELHKPPDQEMGQTDEPTTPRLRPVPSPKLTAPSPFPTEVAKPLSDSLLREIPDTDAEYDGKVDADHAYTSGDGLNSRSQSHFERSPGSTGQDGRYQGDGTLSQTKSVPTDALPVLEHVEDDGSNGIISQPTSVQSEPVLVDDNSVDGCPSKTAKRPLDAASLKADLETQLHVSSSIASSPVAARNDATMGMEPRSAAEADMSTRSNVSQSPSPVQRPPALRPQQSTSSRNIAKSLGSARSFKSGWDEAEAVDTPAFSSGWNKDAGVNTTFTNAESEGHPRISGSGSVLKSTFKSLFGFQGTPSPTKEDPPALASDQYNGADDENPVRVPYNSVKVPHQGSGAPELFPADIPQFDGPAASKPSVFSWKAPSPQKLLPVIETPSEPPQSTNLTMLDDIVEVTEDLRDSDNVAPQVNEPDLPEYIGHPPVSTAQSAIDVIELGSSSDVEDDHSSPVRAVSHHGAYGPSSPYLPSSPAPFDFGALQSVEPGDNVEELDYDAFINEYDDDGEQEDDRSRLASLAVQSIATAGSNEMTPILPDDVESVATAPNAESVRGSSFEPMILEGSATPVNTPGAASPVRQVEEDSAPPVYPHLPGSSPVQLDQPSLTTATADLSFQQISSSPLAQSLHSPAHDIAMLDRSQSYVNEYPPPSHSQPQYLSQLSHRSNRFAVEDSIDSPQTTLIDETSSRPGSGSSMDPVQVSQAALTQKPRPQQRSNIVGFMSASPSPSRLSATNEDHVGLHANSVNEDALSTDVRNVASSPVLDDNTLVYQDAARTASAHFPDPGTLTADPKDPQLAPVLDVQAPNDVLQRLFGISKSFESVTDAAEDPAPMQATSTTLEVSYPRIPLTPSFSQSQSFGFEIQLRPAEASIDDELQPATELPPTPRLTQHLSELAPSVASQNGGQTHENSQLSAAGIREMSANTNEIAQDDVIETPQETLHTRKSALPPAKVVSPPDEIVEQVTSPLKTPHRKSVTARLSHVPEVISAWFSPKSSKASSAIKSATNGHALPASKTSLPAPHSPQSNGLRTPHAYFPALSSLTFHLNTPSQTPPSTVDLLAVITSSPTSPQRAKLGPRDYYTTFRISDRSLPSSSRGARVEVFRHWKAVLPTGEAGDVVLLRGFVVKGLKGGAVGLRASGEGAWCVWRFGEMERLEEGDLNGKNDGLDGGRSRSGSLGVREEVKGPPVEFGEAERQRAQELRVWWSALPKEGKSMDEEEDVDV